MTPPATAARSLDSSGWHDPDRSPMLGFTSELADLDDIPTSDEKVAC